MSERLVTLPDREEMLKRLIAVEKSSHAQQKFYPILLKEASREIYAKGVVTMLTFAIHDYTRGMPPHMEDLVHKRMPKFIDALVTDPEAAAEAKEFYRSAMEA